MAEINKYEITISSKDTSDPKEAESIKKQLDDPIGAVKNQETLLKRIERFAPSGVAQGRISEKTSDFSQQSKDRLLSLMKNATAIVGQGSTKPTKIVAEDKLAKESKGAIKVAKDTTKAASDIKAAAEKIDKAAEVIKKSVVDKDKKEKRSVQSTSKAEDAALWGDQPKTEKPKVVYSPAREAAASREEEAPVKGKQPKVKRVQKTKVTPPVRTYEDYEVDEYTHVEEWQPAEQQKRKKVVPSRKSTGKETSIIDAIVPMSVIDKAASEPIPGVKKERIPPTAKTAEGQSLIDSSNVLMNQIQKEFITFKTKFAKDVKSHLTSAHGEAFKVIGPKKDPYVRRGGVDVLKIADMAKLTSVLQTLTDLTKKEIAVLAKQGPGAMIKKAVGPIMERMTAGYGGGEKGRQKQSTREIAEYINKHGYEGSNKELKAVLKKQAGEPIDEGQVRKLLLTEKEPGKRRSVSKEKLHTLLGETSGRSYMMREYLDEAIKEIEVPRPQKGPQGFPTVRAPSGRHRSLAPEYKFTPGLMVGVEKAKKIQETYGKKPLPGIGDESRLVFRQSAPKVKEMLLGGDKEGVAELSSSVVDVMKTNKKGRVDLINAYRETIKAKGGKVDKIDKEPIPETKKAQLSYLDNLSNKAKKLSLGFDDILVAMGKFSKTGIYDRLYEGLTKETPGVTAPLRTTMRDIKDPFAVDKLKKRIRGEFTDQLLVEEDQPLRSWQQSKSVKVNVPRLIEKEGIVPGDVRKQELSAYNNELEKFLDIKRKIPGGEDLPPALTSIGVPEGRATAVQPDAVDPSRQLVNLFSEKKADFIPSGRWANLARDASSVYHARGGGRTFGGKISEGLELPLVQTKKARALEESGEWGGGGYGLNLQTVIQDSAGNFEDQIEIAGKAVNRFSTYIKPKIKDVKDIGGAEVVAKDIVAQFAPDMAAMLRTEAPGKTGEDKVLVNEISKILTGPGGESLNTRAVKIVEMIFTKLGTKMTTHAGSKGVVSFGTGKKGELGYTTRQTEYHELIQKTLEKKKKEPGTSKEAKKQIDTLITDLGKAGSAPFVGAMHKNLSAKIQEKYKKIRENVNRILDFDVSVTTDPGVSAEKQTKALTSNLANMQKTLGSKEMFKTIPTAVRMSLTGGIKRLNIAEPLEAITNNIIGNVKGVIDPGLTPKDLTQTGEVAQTLQAFGYGWGPEKELPMEERTLPAYSGKGPKAKLSGQKHWRYIRDSYEDWSEKDIASGRKGQSLNVAAMSALTSVFGEESATVKEAMGGYTPGRGKALENIMALKSLGEEPLSGDVPYIPTTGIRELPGVISKHEDLRDTVLERERFGAGGFVKIPEFEEGKEVGHRPLYVPSRESLSMYADTTEGASANKMASLYNSLLANVENYEKIKKTKFTKEDKPDVSYLRESVKSKVGKTTSSFREFLTKAASGKTEDAISGEDLQNLINYFKKTQTILEEAEARKDPALGKMKTDVTTLLKGEVKGRHGVRKGGLVSEISKLEGLSKEGKGLSGWDAVKPVKDLLLNIKDNLLEPKVDTEDIKRVKSDLDLARSGAPLTSMTDESYYFAESTARREGTFDEFEKGSSKARKRVIGGLNNYAKTISAGEGKHGLLSMADASVFSAAEQFGVTTDPKERALQQSVENIEKDRRRLKAALVESTIGDNKGAETLQTGKLPAITGTLSAAINSKVGDFKEAAGIMSRLGAEGVLGDPNDVKSLGNTFVNSIVTQSEKHEKAVEREEKRGKVVLREGEIGLPAGKLEKLKGDYGAVGDNLLDAVRAGEDIKVQTTRFPMTGVGSHQFARARELEHPSGKDVISVPGAAPGIDAEKLKGLITKVKEQRDILRKKRSDLPSPESEDARLHDPTMFPTQKEAQDFVFSEKAYGDKATGAKNLDIERTGFTENILKLSRVIDLLTVKFSGFAQGADIDGDTLMVHAGKTKEAQKEIADVERTRRTGVYGGKGGTLDPRAFINQMTNYNVAGNEVGMAKLAEVYRNRADVPGAEIFKTPDITRKMNEMPLNKVISGLLTFGVTLEKISMIAAKKGLTKPEDLEHVARETLYEKVRDKQYGKMYVKAGLGESTEAANRLSRFLDASVGFGDKPITKKEYGAWTPGMASLGATYGKGGALKQAAKPAREMQTMMSVLLEQVIGAGMSTKHGGKQLFDEVAKGMATGTLFGTMEKDAKLPKKEQRFGGILKANEVIKDTIRDRMDALSSEDYLAEVKRYRESAGEPAKKSDTELLATRKEVTEGLATKFSFKGFLDDMATDIQGQIKETMTVDLMEKKGMPRVAAEKTAEKNLAKQMKKGTLDLGMHFPQMQKAYSLRTTSASVEGLAKHVAKGRSTLDRAITRILDVVRGSGEGVTLSDTMMQNSFRGMFNMFGKAEKLGLNLDKIFKRGAKLKVRQRTMGGVERVLGIPAMSSVEKELIRKEGGEKFIEKFPKAPEEDLSKFQEQYLLTHRERAVRKHVETAKQKKALLREVVPEFAYEEKALAERVQREPRIPRVPFDAIQLPSFRGRKGGLARLSDEDIAKQLAAEKIKSGQFISPSVEAKHERRKDFKKLITEKQPEHWTQGERLDYIHTAREAISTKTGRKQRKAVPEDEREQIRYAKKLAGRLKELELSTYNLLSAFKRLSKVGIADVPGGGAQQPKALDWKQYLKDERRRKEPPRLGVGVAPALGKPRASKFSEMTELVDFSEQFQGLKSRVRVKEKGKQVIRKPEDVAVADKDWRQQLLLGGYAQREPKAARMFGQRSLFPTDAGPAVTDIERGYAQEDLFGKRRKPVPTAEPRPAYGVAYSTQEFAAKKYEVDKRKAKYGDKEQRVKTKARRLEMERLGYKDYTSPFEKDVLLPDGEIPGVSAQIRPTITSRDLETSKVTQVQAKKQVGLKKQDVKAAIGILGGGAEGVSYSIDANKSKELVNILNEYTTALNRLLKNTGTLTDTQVRRAQKALQFVKGNIGKLKQLPADLDVGKASGRLRTAFGEVGQAGLADFVERAGLGGVGAVSDVDVKPREKKKVLTPNKYKTDLQALAGLVSYAEEKTAMAPEDMPPGVEDILLAVRKKQIPLSYRGQVPGEQRETASDLLSVAMKGVPYPKQGKIWSRYHLEKVRGELDLAQAAEEGGDVGKREAAIGRAKSKIESSYEATTSPFLEKEGIGPKGRITGYVDEEAISKLDVYRKPQIREQVVASAKHMSVTAGAAIKPVLMGTGRMEERLKSMWAIVRGFSSEMAQAGKYAKAFNFERAEADLAIIKATLKSFQGRGMFTPEEYSDIEHAVSQVTKAEKAVKYTEEKGLPGLAIPGLETTETAEAAFENAIAAKTKEMEADKDLKIGDTRKVVAKIPTTEGGFEKRTTTLTARGAEEGIYAPGVVGGVKRIDEKPVVGKEAGISRRAVRLIQEFEKSTKNVNQKVKELYLGTKRFNSVAGSVNFDEALKDLADMHALVNQILKTPGLTAEKHAEFSHLKRKLHTALRTTSETPAEALPGMIMKGMETPESAEAAFKEQRSLYKAAMWEDPDLAIGKTMTVAATIPTKAGVEQKRKVQLRAVGEGGVVTSIEEQEFRTTQEYAKELGTGKKTRAKSLVKDFLEGSGDANKRISNLVLGVKQFDIGLAKAGKHTKAINFDNAEKDLVGVIRLLDEALKGAVHLTEEERAVVTQARLVAKTMQQKITKVPAAARKGISMGGYETPESSLVAHRAKIEAETKKLIDANERGKSVVVKSRLMTETGEERPVSKRLTAHGSRFFGFGGPVKRVSEREEVGGGQVGSVVRRVAMWGAASGVIYGILGGVRQMIQTMKQAETGLVNLKKVMSHVTTDFDHMRDSAVRFAKDYGAELMSVFETMRIFAQQGLPQEDVKEMARVSTLAANVTTMKPPEAAEALTSATRQFNIEGEKSIAVLDSWNEVENKFAITAKDLADGFKKAGTAAKITGIDVHKLNGIITSIGEATRQTGKEVGTSLKFIFSRMATEKAPRALTAVGVETMEGGSLREGSDILDDLAVKWVGLTRAQKLATAQAIGGIRHYNALMVMMDNYDRALAATEASINSVGSAEKENKMIMETYEKKAAQMKASFDALAVSAGGPVLNALKAFADSLKVVLEVMGGIPHAGLATGGALAYGGATALGKYFDLSMFGLLGSSVGGAKRKARGPKELFMTPFRGKEAAGREASASFVGGTKTIISSFRTPKENVAARSKWGREDIARRAVGRSGGISLGPEVKKIGLVKKGFEGLQSAVKKSWFSVLGLVASLGMVGKIAIPVAVLGFLFYKFGKSVATTFALAKDRTKSYTESLDAVEERLTAIGSMKTLRTKIEIETKKIGALEARTPEQAAAQIEGRSYKSPILMRKQQIANVKEYAGAVAAMTSEGFAGFDRFGKAVVSSTEDLGGVVDKLEAIGSRTRLELKLYIQKEELNDLVKAPEIDTWIKVVHYKFRELLERMGEEWGTGWLGKYADKMRNPFEAVLHSIKEVNKLRREAGAYGEVIAPPSEKLKEKDPEKYKRVKKRFDEYSEAQSEHMVASKKINEKFLEVRRDFFTLAGPGMTTEGAGQAAFGQTGRLLAEIEKQREPRFYTERGASTEDIQASFFQRLQGVNVRATAEITREAAAEQGIPFRAAGIIEERGVMLEEARAKDVLMFKEGAGIQGEMASVFERNGELWVRYAKQVVEEGKKQLIPVEQTLAQFKELPKYAEQFVGSVSAVGMLTPTQMRLRAISRVAVGAEAGMFKPTKERKLDLGKKYIYQAPTEMLIQNDAFKSFSKTTVAFVNEYIKKQNELRRQQKAALSIYEKRGSIAGETATQIELLTAELAKLSNVAMQSIRIYTDLEKALDQLNVSSAKQAAVHKFRSENLKHLTGPMAGTPMLRTPKIDLRGFFDLTPHERLTVESKKYVSNVQEYNKTMDDYNVAVKKGELGVKALTDISYVKALAKEGADFGDIEDLSKKISKTGDLGSAMVVSELEKQTALGQQAVSNLSNISTLLGGGAAAYAKAAKMPYGVDRKIAMSSAMESVKTSAALALSTGDYDKLVKQRDLLRDVSTGVALAPEREKYKEQYEEATPELRSKMDKFYMSQRKSARTVFRSGEAEINRGFADMFMEQLSSNPDKIKNLMIGSGVISGEKEFEERSKAGTLREVFVETTQEGTTTGIAESTRFKEENVIAVMRFAETLTYSGKLLGEFNERLRVAFYGVEKPQESILVRPTKPKEITNIEDVLGTISQPSGLSEVDKFRFEGIKIPELLPAEVVETEMEGKIKGIIASSAEEIATLGKALLELGLPLTEVQKAVRNFDKASGQLGKEIANLADKFRDLERQSAVNKELIKVRADYLSTRGGPLKRTAPAVNVDVATTAAQYSTHDVLYNKDRQYGEVTRSYLDTAEDVKTARSKMEEIAKIRGKAKFLEGQGIDKGELSTFIDAALTTGSTDSALIVTEISKLIKVATNIEDKIGKPEGEVEGKGIGTGTLTTITSLDDTFTKAAKENKAAEAKNIAQAKYLSTSQIREQTRIDVATGAGKSQDQINREESGFMAKFGYVPTEIKERNKKLLEVYEAEKEARATFELEKRKILEPLQQSVSGMKSIIDSIKTGISGIEGGRNVRPLEEDFGKWSERHKRNRELVADRSMQFGLAKSLYSQNLNLRAQGADTGVAPRALYDIMEKASKGEDITKDLEAIQPMLKEAVEKREEQIRKVQAEEYARAVQGAMEPSENKLGTIDSSIGKLLISGKEVGNSIVDALNSAKSVMGGEAGVPREEAPLSEGQQKAKEVLGSAITFPKEGESMYGKPPLDERQQKAKRTLGSAITFPEKGESMSDFTARMEEKSRRERTIDASRAGLRITPVSDEAKRVYGDTEALKDIVGATAPAKEKKEISTPELFEANAQVYSNIYSDIMKSLPKKEELIIPKKEETVIPTEVKDDLPKAAETSFSEIKGYVLNFLTDVQKITLDGLEEERKNWQEMIDSMLGGSMPSSEGDAPKSNLKPKTISPEDAKKIGTGARQEEDKEIKEVKRGTDASKDLNTEVSDLKDEVETLKNTISDVNIVFGKLSKSIEGVDELGSKSKDSVESIKLLDQAASSASASLDIFSSKANTTEVYDTGTGPTAEAKEGVEYISEEDATNMVAEAKKELSERIVELSDDSDTVKALVEKTTTLTDDIKKLKENVPTDAEGSMSAESFNEFKEEVSEYFRTIEELKEITDDLDKGLTTNTASVLGLEAAFELINKKLEDHENQYSKLQENFDLMDHMFTEAIVELESTVSEVADLANAAYSFATQT